MSRVAQGAQGATLKVQRFRAFFRIVAETSAAFARERNAFQATAEHIARRKPFPGIDPLPWREIEALHMRRTASGIPALAGEPDPASQIHQIFPPEVWALLRKEV